MTRCTHEHSEQLICNLREEVSTVLSTLSNFMYVLMETVAGPHLKKGKTKAMNIDVALRHAHDWIKVEVALDLLDYAKGTNNFPATLVGSA